MSTTEQAPDTSSEPPGPTGPTSVVNWRVFVAASALIIAITVWAMIDRDGADAVIGAVVGAISAGFGWWYFLLATSVIVFVLFIAFSRYGSVRLGPDHSRPTYNVFTWGSMLFAAGIGIDLMFFSVSGPVSHYLEPPVGPGMTPEAARMGVVWTLFHYGITGWAMYALIGAALGYFAYRRGMPLSIRSALYPIIGRRIHGATGDVIETAAVIGTIFGIATSLGIGVVQLNFGLSFMFGLPQNEAMQIALIAVAVGMATISVVTGVDRGIRRLSELNVILAVGLMLFVLVSGRTQFLLDALVMNIGQYIASLPALTLDTFAFEAPTEWMNDWTLFFWAWWIAWAPFVGLFLARISRGRTLRQFIVAVLTIPFLFIAAWISLFGNAALDVVIAGDTAFGLAAMNEPESGFYTLLAQYPAVTLTAGIATFTGLLFYVTSADSGALVMAKFTSRLDDPQDDGPNWSRIFWAVATGLLTLAMLLVGGVPTLQSATIVMGLPFSFVMVAIMVGLYRALRDEAWRVDGARASERSSMSERVTPDDGGRSWRQRLTRSLSYPGAAELESYLDQTARPALAEVCAELGQRGLDARLTDTVEPGTGVTHLDVVVEMADDSAPFRYQLWPQTQPVPSYHLVATSKDVYYRLEVHLTHGSQEYDVLGYSRDQLIGDVLDQYERHLEYLRLQNERASPP